MYVCVYSTSLYWNINQNKTLQSINVFSAEIRTSVHLNSIELNLYMHWYTYTYCIYKIVLLDFNNKAWKSGGWPGPISTQCERKSIEIVRIWINDRSSCKNGRMKVWNVGSSIGLFECANMYLHAPYIWLLPILCTHWLSHKTDNNGITYLTLDTRSIEYSPFPNTFTKSEYYSKSVIAKAL